jgi:hypothetical protein
MLFWVENYIFLWICLFWPTSSKNYVYFFQSRSLAEPRLGNPGLEDWGKPRKISVGIFGPIFEPRTTRPQLSVFSLRYGLTSWILLTRVSTSRNVGWTTGRSGLNPRQGQRIFPLSSLSRQPLGPTQPPVQWVPGVLSPGVKRGRGVMLFTHPHLVPRSWMSRSYTSSPPSASMACRGTALLF